MRIKDAVHYALSSCVAATMLAGCGGSQPPIGAPGAMQQSAGITAPESAAAARTVVHRPYHAGPLSYELLYSFRAHGKRPDGNQPSAGLVEVNGTLYGTTYKGGAHGDGTVFSITTGGTEKVLYDFAAGTDGDGPLAALVNVKGTLYGTTWYGGKYKEGTVFSVSTAGTEHVLHSFAGGTDGAGPVAGLIDVSGTLYGTTEAGGGVGCDGYGCGTVFSITASGKETVLHSFGGAGSGDGAEPSAGLVNVNGTLYGTTYSGNASGVYGTVFAITPSGKETVLHGFKGSPSDGAEPWAGLVNVNGTLYGTTSVGGANSCQSSNQGCGTVFSITPSGTENVLYSFKGGTSDGGVPRASLLNVNGTIYGTTYYGGENGGGTVFSITSSGGETVIHNFAARDGGEPQADLINVNGTLYGTTTYGGRANRGTVFSLSP